MEPLLFSIIHSKFVSYVSEPEQGLEGVAAGY
jgi:hypothetical protein